jgi:cytochrome c-type biogenesis protein
VTVAWGVAFLAGLWSLASPCVWPLLPAYLGYLAGSAPSRSPGRLLTAAAAFVAGFTVVFVLLGSAATAAGSLLGAHVEVVERLGGLVVVALGLALLGLLPLGPLGRTATWASAPRTPGPGGAFLLGLGFAAGWTPCVGPVLAAILVLASEASQVARGAELLLAYALGMGLPFVTLALATGLGLSAWPRLRRFRPAAEKVGGLILVGLGAVMALGWYGRLVGRL